MHIIWALLNKVIQVVKPANKCSTQRVTKLDFSSELLPPVRNTYHGRIMAKVPTFLTLEQYPFE
jgi:hypothetical protein